MALGRSLDIRVLGCHGGEMAGFLAPSLLIDDTILLDAGSFSSCLSLSEQLRIDHVLVSHAHCDHVKDLAAFADLIIGRRRKPVVVHASPGAMAVLKGDLFNNRLWPDFFNLPSPDAPVLQGRVFAPRRVFRVGRLRVRAVAVNHPVESMGFVVRGPTGAFLYTGDTGPTEGLWRQANRTRGLKLAFIETKFPNDLQFVADAAGHLTPATLAQELAKLRRPGLPISIYHIKPDRFAEVVSEIAKLGRRSVRVMRIGDRFRV